MLIYLFKPPDERQAIGPLAEQVELLEGVARRAHPPWLQFSRSQPEAKSRADLTSWLRDALKARGVPRDVVVSRKNDLPLLSIPVDQGWIVTQIPDLPPPGGVFNLILMWLSLIAFGAMAVALFFANRMVKPLVLLEKAIESVGPDALLPELAITGPAEVRVTARALNSLSSRLKVAMESRMRLVAAAGHDLRTPITRMRLRAEFVEDDDDRAMWLKDIDELARIADSAILLVREESGKSAPEISQTRHADFGTCRTSCGHCHTTSRSLRSTAAIVRGKPNQSQSRVSKSDHQRRHPRERGRASPSRARHRRRSSS